MPESLKSQAIKALATAIAVAPWLISMYVFYWLDASQTWTSETPHRGKLSVALLASGMLFSFLLHNHFTKHSQKERPKP